jgi:hypothetical protein
MYLLGAEIQERAVNEKSGYAEAKVMGVWANEGRLIMTRKMGRLLEDSEVVGHRDFDVLNNTTDNLYLTTRRAYARAWWNGVGRQQRERSQ